MNKKCPKILEERMIYRIDRRKSEIVMREDFKDLSGYDQVGRVLRNLVKKGKLIRIGYGLYAKATKSPLSDELIPRKGINALAKEALARLNVKTFPTSYEITYNEEKSTQVPSGRVIGVKDRISRKIGYNGRWIAYERVLRR